MGRSSIRGFKADFRQEDGWKEKTDLFVGNSVRNKKQK